MMTRGCQIESSLANYRWVSSLFFIEDDGTNQVVYTYGDDLISQDRDGDAYFYHYDGLGSTRSLTDSLGNLANTYDYEAFGEVLNQTGSVENSYLFAGEQFDTSLDQYYLRARYYDQSSGRFTQQDTWMGNNHDPITLHKYLYANADPGNMIDPSGHFGLASLGTTLNILGNIMTTVSTAYSVFQIATGEKELSARELGSAIILNLAFRGGGKLADKFFAKLAVKIGCNSFTHNTLVNTKDGLVEIQDVKIGDFVWTYDEEDKTNEYKEVIHLIQRTNEYRLINVQLEDGTTIEATELHPFFVNSKWIDAKDLKVDDQLHLTSGRTVNIKSLSEVIKSATVYNLTVEGNHNYFVGDSGVLVHNCGQNLLTARAVAEKAFSRFKKSSVYKKAKKKNDIALFVCTECADEFEMAFRRSGVRGKRIGVRYPGPQTCRGARIWNDKSRCNIATNGIHEAVEVDGVVFDNINPGGIPRSQWENQFANIRNNLEFKDLYKF
ncbi:MAG: polymorphic toxin-type HINT domain-containing protein [Candidatus Thiodiazotropha endolucinida]